MKVLGAFTFVLILGTSAFANHCELVFGGESSSVNIDRIRTFVHARGSRVYDGAVSGQNQAVAQFILGVLSKVSNPHIEASIKKTTQERDEDYSVNESALFLQLTDPQNPNNKSSVSLPLSITSYGSTATSEALTSTAFYIKETKNSYSIRILIQILPNAERWFSSWDISTDTRVLTMTVLKSGTLKEISISKVPNLNLTPEEPSVGEVLRYLIKYHWDMGIGRRLGREVIVRI